MSERGSILIMGSKHTIEKVTPEPTGISATYRYTRGVMGLTVDFSESVTRYIPGHEIVWQTIGVPRLLILDSYEMRVQVEPNTDTTTRLTITIDYALSQKGFWCLLGRLLTAPYAH